jgi:hypothetical protein
MNTLPTTAHQQRNSVFALAALSMIVLLCLQIWLLIEVIHGALGGEGGYFLSATMISAVCVAGNWQLWNLLQRRIGDSGR